MAKPREFGLELCLKSHAEDVKTRNDVLLTIVHWRLLRHSFLCIGDIFFTHHIPSELLPLNLGWNGDVETYTVKYVFKNRLFILILICGTHHMDLKLHSDTEIVSVAIDIGDAVDNDMIINMDKCHTAARKIDKDLIEVLLKSQDFEDGPLINVMDLEA